jgi:RNA polymerase sigma factor (sigma-70 family)
MDGTLMSVPTELRAQNERIAAAFAEQRSRLQAFVRRQLGDALEAEDVVQEVFSELLAAYRLMQPIEHLAAWLMKVAHNRVIDRVRARTKQRRVRVDAVSDPDAPGGPILEERQSFLDSLELPDAAGPESIYNRAVLADALEAALAELPAEQRDAFIAHELEGRSIREIAAAQGVPVNTLLWRKRAAVLHLRTRLRVIYDPRSGEIL